MCTRSAAGVTTAPLLLFATACGGNRSGSGREAASADTEAPSTGAPVSPPPAEEAGTPFSPALFGADSATIDDAWYPHTPGTRFVYEGHARDGDETIDRRIVATVTDVTKEAAGVRAIVVIERDYEEMELVERTRLTPAEVARARAEVLAMEDRGDAYSRLGPVQPIGTW